MLSILGRAHAACDRQSRRRLLQIGGTGLFGLSCAQLQAAVEQRAVAPNSADRPKARSVIFMMLFGGPSQLETFDLKPHAPDQIRGPFQPIASRTPELLISEHLPKLATVSDTYCVIRTMSHSFNDHSGGGHYLQTGKRWHIPIGGGFSATPKDWPSMGSVVEYVDQQRAGLTAPMPSYLVVPNSLGTLEDKGQYKRPGEYGGWLGQRYNGLTTKINKRSHEDNPYWRDCTDEELTYDVPDLKSPAEITLDRLDRRRSLLQQFDTARRRHEQAGTFDDFRGRAFSLMTSESIRTALEIQRESAAVRDRYGRHLFGQSSLMARRLVEAGARFVTVHYEAIDGYSWDSHRNSDDVRKHLLPTFDQACATLLSDLDERGLLDETLVIACGEMGRTPKANATWGRDHWSTLFPALIAGGGVRGATVYGSSDKDAAFATDAPVSPEDLAATVYHALGIDPELRIPNAEGRPMQIVEGGSPVRGLWEG